jgi:hypothetical protein
MTCPDCQSGFPEKAEFSHECFGKTDTSWLSRANLDHPGGKILQEKAQNRLKPTKGPPQDLFPNEQLAEIQKFLPSGVTEKVLSLEEKIEDEQRQVTIIFVTMKLFTGQKENTQSRFLIIAMTRTRSHWIIEY